MSRRAVDLGNIVESKRSRKPKQSWEPEDHREIQRPRKSTSNQNAKHPRRNRNEAASSDHSNRWEEYKHLVKKFVSGLVKENHYLELYSQSQTLKEGDKELKRIKDKVKAWKQAIISTVTAIESEYADHKRWPELGEADDDDMVEVAHILCSACNGEECEGNDILFCDRTSCLRAYHQLCLQPPITLQGFDESQDWFCWQCECLDDCIDLISERLGEEYTCAADLFPEVQRERDAELAAGNTLAGAVLGDEEDDVDDDEYQPTLEEVAAEGEEEEDASAASDGELGDEEEDEAADAQDGADDDEGGDEEGGEGAEGKESSLLSRLQALHGDNDAADHLMAYESDGEDVSDIDSALDEDEVAGLLEDAAGDLGALPFFDRPSDAAGEAAGDDGGESGGVYRRRLRDRSKRQAAKVVHIFGEDDVGRPVARVHCGTFVTGTVTAFSFLADDDAPAGDGSAWADLDDRIAQRGRWTVAYRDGLVREGLALTDVRTALELAREYEERQEALRAAASGNTLQSKISALVQSNGQLSAENVLQHRREKKAIDYVSLSLQIFGSLYDEDDDRILDDEAAALGGDRASDATARRLMTARRSGAAGAADDDEDDADPLGLAAAVERDEDYDSDDARPRRRKRTPGRGGGGAAEKKRRPRRSDGDDSVAKKRRTTTPSSEPPVG